MNDLSGFYSEYEGKSKEWNTKTDSLLENINEILDLKFHGLDKLTQVGLFLDQEETQLKDYMDNLVIHYTYKRIFNKAKKYFDENKEDYFKNEINFVYDFQEYLLKEFDLKEYKRFKIFAKELLHSILSNESTIDSKVVNGRPTTKENIAMRKFAFSKQRDHCYLCGIKTVNNKERTKINLQTWHNENKSEYSKELYSNYKEILNIHNKKIKDEIVKNYLLIPKKGLINKVLNNKYYSKLLILIKKIQFLKQKDFNKKKNLKDKNFSSIFFRKEKVTINNLFAKISLNKLNQEFKNAYNYYNNAIMKIEHCVSVDWGGGKTENNLLISCHKCNQVKSNTVFFTEYSINKFFINEFIPSKAKKAFHGTLGNEALISLKIKQNFKCSDCEKEFSELYAFYLRRININDGYHYLNTLITCEKCLQSYNKMDSKEYIQEFIKIKDS